MCGCIVPDVAVSTKVKVPARSQASHVYQSPASSLALNADAPDWKLKMISVLWNRPKRTRKSWNNWSTDNQRFSCRIPYLCLLNWTLWVSPDKRKLWVTHFTFFIVFHIRNKDLITQYIMRSPWSHQEWWWPSASLVECHTLLSLP